MTLRKILLLLVAALCMTAVDAQKREFRGAWLHTVFQGQYAKQSTTQNKSYLRAQLDSLKAAGVNVVVFQVRPSADAFYQSSIEPWSRFLTGTAGKAPAPFWDPLQFMIEEAHARGMELHAWLNPYRATTSKNEKLPTNHPASRHPERFVKYADGKLYFDPGLPENRRHIVEVVSDIVERYDVDAIHFDDYFYPYPVNGQPFNDDASYKKYGDGMALDDWRRRNVDLLIEDVSEAIKGFKPWVRFGISPFGIWRNKTSDPRGSDTNGLENYDALYADVLLWAERGWIDYLAPQLYWSLDHKAAPYRVLLPWWNEATPEPCHLYIGQDVERTMNDGELAPKLSMMADSHRVKGLIWWPGYSISANYASVADSISSPQIHGNFALVPSYENINAERPKRIKNLHNDHGTLRWSAYPLKGEASDPVKYVIYRFDSPKDVDLDSSEAILAITPSSHFEIQQPGIYVVTALSRTNIESAPSSHVKIN